MTRDTNSEAQMLFQQHIKPLLDEIRDSQSEDDAEYFAGSIVYHLRGVLGWSVAYYGKADALHYWCIASDYDFDELTHEQKVEFEDFWSTWRHSKAWDDALWLDEYTGESMVELINWHIRETEGEEAMTYRYVITTENADRCRRHRRLPVGDAQNSASTSVTGTSGLTMTGHQSVAPAKLTTLSSSFWLRSRATACACVRKAMRSSTPSWSAPRG